MNRSALQPVRFVLTGIANTAIGLTIIFTAKGVLGLDDFIANLSGYSIGLLSSFFLNRKWTFQHDGRISHSAMRFASAFIFSYITNLITVYWLRDSIGLNAYLAQALGTVPYTLIFFLACRYYVFTNQQAKN